MNRARRAMSGTLGFVVGLVALHRQSTAARLAISFDGRNYFSIDRLCRQTAS